MRKSTASVGQAGARSFPPASKTDSPFDSMMTSRMVQARVHEEGGGNYQTSSTGDPLTRRETDEHARDRGSAQSSRS